MIFKDFKQVVQRRFNEMLTTGPIFNVEIDKDEIWELYLASYPEGTNKVFRERAEHDCSACKSFIRNAGGMVNIVDGVFYSIWDLSFDEATEYQIVADALANYVRSKSISNVFLHTEHSIGIDKNREEIDDSVRTWEHLHITLPNHMIARGDQIGPKHAEYRAMYDVVLRSLTEIKPDAIETVKDLIAQNSLYRGAEKANLVATFGKVKNRFDAMGFDQREASLFAWSQVVGPDSFVCKIRNDVIGTLLVDLSEGVELEAAVKSFEDKVSGTNYQRPTALVTPRMRDAAKAKVEELGLLSALDRRYAVLEDINVTNVLFANRDVKKRLGGGGAFDDIPTKSQTSKQFDKTEEITIEKFLKDVLPTATSVEVFLENKHAGNLVSLVAPTDLTAKQLFKWNNPFSWSYAGDVADSIKERVKAAGGNVVGDVCCRLAWFNYDDLDLHMMEPDGTHIFYRDRSPRSTKGQLDVDMNAGSGQTRTPVENIFYPSKSTMKLGTYTLSVNQFQRRETSNPGFEVEIDIMGVVHQFTYDKVVAGDVEVADLNVTANGITVVPKIPSTQTSKDMWGLKTQEFQQVTAIMLSPNFWNGESVGNKHFFFMLNNCENAETARGFYNEFLHGDLTEHRKVMELVGSKARTDQTKDQMSGLGFSSTQRNEVVVRVNGSFTRTLKVIF